MPDYNKEKVARAAKLMDKLVPGWYKAIQLELLNMEHGAMCVMGQVFGVNVEKTVIKEAYPGEYAEALSKAPSKNGWSVGRNGVGSLVERMMNKRGMLSREDRVDYWAMELVCDGSDTRCEWIEEIATRLAQDEEDAHARTHAATGQESSATTR